MLVTVHIVWLVLQKQANRLELPWMFTQTCWTHTIILYTEQHTQIHAEQVQIRKPKSSKQSCSCYTVRLSTMSSGSFEGPGFDHYPSWEQGSKSTSQQLNLAPFIFGFSFLLANSDDDPLGIIRCLDVAHGGKSCCFVIRFPRVHLKSWVELSLRCWSLMIGAEHTIMEDFLIGLPLWRLLALKSSSGLLKQARLLPTTTVSFLASTGYVHTNHEVVVAETSWFNYTSTFLQHSLVRYGSGLDHLTSYAIDYWPDWKKKNWQVRHRLLSAWMLAHSMLVCLMQICTVQSKVSASLYLDSCRNR